MINRNECPKFGRFEQLVEWCCAFSLYHGKSRQAIDESEPGQFVKSFAESRTITQVAAGQYDPIWRVPVQLLEHLDDYGFLAFEPERVDRVQKVESGLDREFANDSHCIVKAPLELDDPGAVFKRLSQLAIGNTAGWNEDHGLNTGSRGIGGHGSRCVPCRGAGDGRRIGHARGSDASSHPIVFERPGWIHSLVLEP